MKIFVTCKDKTSSRWIASQNISVLGDIPKQVEETSEVNQLIKNGVLKRVGADVYERYHKKVKASDEDKLKSSIELINGIIDSVLSEEDEKKGNASLSKAEKLIATLVKQNGLKGSSLKKVKASLADVSSKFEAKLEHAVRTDEAKELVEKAIENETLISDDGGFICLGDKKLGKDVDQVIAWASSKDEFIEELKAAIEAPKEEEEEEEEDKDKNKENPK